MRLCFLPLALLFLAFTDPSIAQKAETATAAAAPAGEVVVREGAPLTVECSLRVDQPAEWRVDGALPAGDMRPGERPAGGAGRLQARLHAAAARAQHAGLYTCGRGAAAQAVRVRVLPAARASTGDGVPAAMPSSTDLPAGEDVPVDNREIVMFELYKPLQFNCSFGGSVSHYDWFINGTAVVSGVGRSGPVIEPGGAILTVPRAHEEDWGNYSCSVGGDVVKEWRAHAKPIARVPANTNVVEGQKFSITCRLIGKPYQRVHWTYAPYEGVNGTLVDTTAGGRFSTKDSPAGVPDGVLEVTDAVREDAGLYACVPPNGTAAESTLRVKDVYAALWPFLGICLEVFILCAIILVYEKRRTKPELDDSDADTHDQKKT